MFPAFEPARKTRHIYLGIDLVLPWYYLCFTDLTPVPEKPVITNYSLPLAGSAIWYHAGYNHPDPP